MSDHLYAVIMAGGVGSRLWPRSREKTPKQFLDLLGARTMLQETMDRIEPLIPLERVLVVVGEEHAATVQAQVPDLPAENIIRRAGTPGHGSLRRPGGHCSATTRSGRLPWLSFRPTTALPTRAGFRQAIAAAAQVAQDGYLVTLGIAPAQPTPAMATSSAGSVLGEMRRPAGLSVRRFTEKPDAATRPGICG